MFGLDYVIFRPHNVYGERQNIGDRYRNVVGIFMNQILQGQPMTIFGDGTQTRAFSYIDDVAPVMAAAIDVPARLEPGVQRRRRSSRARSTSWRARVAAAMGVEPRDQAPAGAARSPARALEPRQGARACFGAGDATPLDDGLRAMAAWVQAAGRARRARRSRTSK